MIRNTLIKAAAICCLFAAQACSPKLYPTRIEYRDSLRVEYRERIVHDTAFLEIPREAEKVVTRDTSSHLENSYAKSDAVIKDGLLHHSLETKPQRKPVPVDVPVRDTVYIEHTVEAQTQTITTNELNKTQKGMIGGFWALLVLTIALAAWRVYKLIR